MHALSGTDRRRRVILAESGVDLRTELRYYTRAQLLVFVPLLLVWFELRADVLGLSCQ